MYMFSLTENDYNVIQKIIVAINPMSNNGGLKQETFEKLRGKYTK